MADAGLSFGRFCRESGFKEFLEDELAADDPPEVIAAKAILFLCTDDDGRFNGNTARLKAVLQFLSARATLQPEEDADLLAALRDLRNRLDGRSDLAHTLAWVRQWYRF